MDIGHTEVDAAEYLGFFWCSLTELIDGIRLQRHKIIAVRGRDRRGLPRIQPLPTHTARGAMQHEGKKKKYLQVLKKQGGLKLPSSKGKANILGEYNPFSPPAHSSEILKAPGQAPCKP